LRFVVDNEYALFVIPAIHRNGSFHGALFIRID
jgi:hypothetical protein